MKIMLINPAMSYADMPQMKARGCMPPLDLLYLSAYLLRGRHDVFLLDAYARPISVRETLSIIERFSPQAVGFASYTATIDQVFMSAAAIKEAFPKIKIVLGGIHASYLPEVCLDSAAVDVIVRGDGELTFSKLIAAWESGRDIAAVNGIAYKKNGTVSFTAGRECIDDLDSLPWPAYNLIDFKNYFLSVTRAVTNKKVASVLTMRGCPYRCTFCSHPYRNNGGVRKRNPEDAVRELAYLHDAYGIKEVQIEDSSFTCDPERVKYFCRLIIKKKLPLVWNCNIRADTVSEELVALMRSAGCRRVLLGAESGVQRMLDSMKKGITIDQIRQTVRLAKKYGIRINCSFIIGTPGETMATAGQTARFARELDPDYVMFSVLVPSIGSELFESAVRRGAIDARRVKGGDYISVYSSREPIVQMSGLNKRELSALMERFTLQFYLRPGYIFKRLRQICSLRELSMLFWGAALIFNHQRYRLKRMLCRVRRNRA